MQPGFLQGVLFALWAGYVIIKDLIVPLANKIMHRKEDAAPRPECPLLQPLTTRVNVLEVNLARESSRMLDLAEALKEHVTSTSHSFDVMENKLDMVLQELKEFRESVEDRVSKLGERMKGAEVNLEHLLKRRGRAGGD